MTGVGTDSAGAREAGPAFRELSTMLHAPDEPMSAVLRRVAELARDVVPELDDVSVTLLDGRRPRSVVFTGRLAVDLDERQYERGFGPCLDAATSGSTIAVDTSDPSGPYPDFATIAASRGVRHSLSVGLPVSQRVIGALNMYSCAAQPASAGSVALAQAFARYAGVAVANAGLYRAAVEETAQMKAAMRTRAVIEQAKGVVMATRHCTAEAAFDLLVRASQHQNRKLHDVAADLVERTSQPAERATRGGTAR